ncbi:hypothetical protein VE03_02675 [Pseudogymnoascus sp. 23342-1-I1]|nr:hypothetical protein VE03_02675 [Pseudogymnoascus sp. 23342-1-I1]
MARTKQTARRSTAGIAPRRQLAGAGGSQPIRYDFDYGNLPLKQYVVSKEPIIPGTAMDSNAAAPSEAQMKVFSTPEMLAIILSQLPHSSLLTAKLVNKTWAGLFENAEIRASLFECPRPKELALYTEAYSDLLMNRFLAPWPTSRAEYGSQSYSWQWRQLLVCQPPVEALEIVQRVDQRGGGLFEFRTIIPRPNGLRMGFLYDAIKYWHRMESRRVKLLWNRRTGDLTDSDNYYPDGPSYKTFEDKPCVTISGKTSAGCGSSGGLTFEHYQSTRNNAQAQRSRIRIIKSGDEKVEFSMSEPKRISIDLTSLYEAMKRDEEDYAAMEKDEEDADS